MLGGKRLQGKHTLTLTLCLCLLPLALLVVYLVTVQGPRRRHGAASADHAPRRSSGVEGDPVRGAPSSTPTVAAHEPVPASEGL